MTPQELQDQLALIIKQVNSGANIAAAFRPEIGAYVVIGQAVANLLPGIAGDVARWIGGEKQTPEEEAEVSRKISVLLDPNLP